MTWLKSLWLSKKEGNQKKRILIIESYTLNVFDGYGRQHIVLSATVWIESNTIRKNCMFSFGDNVFETL